MRDLQQYVAKRKKRDREFAEGYEIGYDQFEVDVLLRQARQEAGLTQEQLARGMKTGKVGHQPAREPCRGYQAQ